MIKKWMILVLLAALAGLWITAGDALAQPREITIAATEWAPYSAPDLPDNGFLAEIAVTALNRAGYKANVKFFPWKRAVMMTEEGLTEALLGASHSPEREKLFIYPRYAWDNYIFFFARKGHNLKHATPEDLCPARVGVFSGSIYARRFGAVSCLQVDEVQTIQQNIRKLLAGRIDVFIDSSDAVDYYMDRDFPDQKNAISPLTPHYEVDKVYVVISRSIPESESLAADFDRGMEAIRADGTYAGILEKHGTRR